MHVHIDVTQRAHVCIAFVHVHCYTSFGRLVINKIVAVSGSSFMRVTVPFFAHVILIHMRKLSTEFTGLDQTDDLRVYGDDGGNDTPVDFSDIKGMMCKARMIELMLLLRGKGTRTYSLDWMLKKEDLLERVGVGGLLIPAEDSRQRDIEQVLAHPPWPSRNASGRN